MGFLPCRKHILEFQTPLSAFNIYMSLRSSNGRLSIRHSFVFPETALLAAGRARKLAFRSPKWVILYRPLLFSNCE